MDQHFFVRSQMIDPYSPEVRRVERGWEILCPPGPLARLLLNISGSLTLTEWQGDNPYLVIPLTPELDQAIAQIIPILIDLRYRTGQVQLELWGNL